MRFNLYTGCVAQVVFWAEDGFVELVELVELVEIDAPRQIRQEHSPAVPAWIYWSQAALSTAIFNPSVVLTISAA